MIKKILPYVALLLVAADPALAQVNKVRPGLGDDPGVPLTQPLQLPRGVRLDGPIWGADADGGECKDKSLTVGKGRGVKACAAFCMDSTTYVGTDGQSFDIRDGLILISEYQEGQNGLLIGRVRINMPYTPCGPGGLSDEDEKKKRRKFVVEFNMQCLNEKKSPSFQGMKYSFGGVTTDPEMLELLAILATKKVETEEHQDVVGNAVYSITEHKGLTQEDRRALAALPNRTSRT